MITLPGARRPEVFTRCIVSLRDGPAIGVQDFDRGSAFARGYGATVYADITDYVEGAIKLEVLRFALAFGESSTG